MDDAGDFAPSPPVVHPRRRPTAVRAAIAILVGFSTLIAIGTLFLVTPIASERGTWTSPIDALFTSVSAASDTGLVVVDTADYWSFWGELAIAALITVGGLGIMASTTLAVLLGRRASLASRATVIDTFGGSLGGARDIVRRAVLFALADPGRRRPRLPGHPRPDRPRAGSRGDGLAVDLLLDQRVQQRRLRPGRGRARVHRVREPAA